MRLMRELTSGQSLIVLSLLLSFQLAGCTTTRTEDDDTTNTFVSVVDMSALSATGDAGTISFDEGDDLVQATCDRFADRAVYLPMQDLATVRIRSLS